jgi:hypothetical protein
MSAQDSSTDMARFLRSISIGVDDLEMIWEVLEIRRRSLFLQ